LILNSFFIYEFKTSLLKKFPITFPNRMLTFIIFKIKILFSLRWIGSCNMFSCKTLCFNNNFPLWIKFTRNFDFDSLFRLLNHRYFSLEFHFLNTLSNFLNILRDLLWLLIRFFNMMFSYSFYWKSLYWDKFNLFFSCDILWLFLIIIIFLLSLL
jgi:hypothetical protein